MLAMSLYYVCCFPEPSSVHGYCSLPCTGTTYSITVTCNCNLITNKKLELCSLLTETLLYMK